MTDKLELINKLNIILSIQNMPIHLDLYPMMNYSGLEIEKFVRWPLGEDFNKYTYDDILENNTYPQKELTSFNIMSSNFDILLCLKDKTIEKYSFNKCLQLYEENKKVLDRKDDF